jgi:GAF domain-containing protein
VGEGGIGESLVSPQAAAVRQPFRAELVAAVVTDAFHVAAALQRAQQTEAGALGRSELATDLLKAQGGRTVPQQFKDVETAVHHPDRVAAESLRSRPVFHVLKCRFSFVK